MLAFGELCRYKCRAQEGGIAGTKWRFSTGVWLGFERRTGHFVVYDKAMGGVKHARTLVPMPKPLKFSVEAIQSVAATPWSIHEAERPEVVKVDGGIAQGARASSCMGLTPRRQPPIPQSAAAALKPSGQN